MIIKNAKIITFEEPNRIINGGAVKISNQGKIEAVYTAETPFTPENGEDVIDAQGQYLMPAGICAHTHFYGAFSRGMYIPGDAPDAFPAIL